MWIFSGFINQRDSYKQHPSNIIKFWQLEKWSRENEILFLIVAATNFIYPLYDSEGNLSDWIVRLDNLRKNLAGEKEYFIGISTGVEGAIKFSYFYKKASIIALSGTFDYNSLDKSSGEYKIHLKEFGYNIERWNKENPLNILSEFQNATLYLFCEKNSIYSKEQKIVLNANLTNLTIKTVILDEENTYHNWQFWANEKVLSNIKTIIN